MVPSRAGGHAPGEACRVGGGVHGALASALGGDRSRALGYGGIALVARATGIARSTIQRGLRELARTTPLAAERTRQPAGDGSARRTLDPTLLRDLDALVEPTAPGDPDSPLRWTSMSVRTLAVALDGLGHHVSHTVVAELLHGLGYSLQGNVKTREGRQHADRDAQFRYIARRVRAAQRAQQPTISVDTKKKELIGDFKNAGRTWRPGHAPAARAGPRLRDPDPAPAARPFRTASTISIATKAGSVSGSITTPRPSPCSRSGTGGGAWAVRCIARPGRC